MSRVADHIDVAKVPALKRLRGLNFRWIVLIVLITGLTLFALYFWPTRYRYEVFNEKGFPLVVRVDRVTGDVELIEPRFSSEDEGLQASRKRVVKNVEPNEVKWKEMALEKGYATGILYNGSFETVTEFTISFTVKEANKVVLRRAFRLEPVQPVRPLRIGAYKQFVNIDLEEGQTWEWAVLRVRGRREEDSDFDLSEMLP